MNPLRKLVLVCAVVLTASPVWAEDSGRGTRNVILITTDGLRWQDLFRGADELLLNKDNGGVENVAALRAAYWRETPEARREALMPFFWTTIAQKGQIFGNADRNSRAHVTNGHNFSYPGYNELFTGAADPRVDSNDKKPNPNVSVFEWLNLQPAFAGKVAAVGSWDLYPYILNVDRSKLPVNAGWQLIAGPDLGERTVLLNRQMTQTERDWSNSRNDVFTTEVAFESLHQSTPRVFYVGLGDTDEYAHMGRYDQYLHAAHQVDAFLKNLWEAIQAHPQYKDSTTLIVTTDHGRGDPPKGWRDHGAKVAGSEAIWMAVIGPDTKPLGERSDIPAVTQSQIAATMAHLLGLPEFQTASPQAAAPIADVLKAGSP